LIGALPQTQWGSFYTAIPQLDLRGHNSKGGRRKGKGRKGEKSEMEGKGKGEELRAMEDFHKYYSP